MAKTALIIGDSHVEPVGALGPDLAKLLQAQGYSVTVAGVGSSNGLMWATKQVVCRPDNSWCVDQSKLPHSPDLLVVSLGTNDVANAAAGGRSVAQAVADIKKAIASYNAKQTFWIGPPATRDNVKYYTNAAVAAFYKAAGSAAFDSRPATQAAVNAGQGDGVHLYGVGAQTWANAIASAIKSGGTSSLITKIAVGAAIVSTVTAIVLWRKGYFR
jgi:lysophospholipase L1-like esterase